MKGKELNLMNRLSRIGAKCTKPRRRGAALLAAIAVAGFLLAACQAVAADSAPTAPAVTGGESLVVYSGRSENLVAPIIERFAEETGIQVEVRYGDTAEMAATILEEGRNSPAEVFFGQDAGALGALAKAGRLQPLPADLLELVPPQYRSVEGKWIGVSGRARVLVYNTELVAQSELPQDVWELTQDKWRGKVGWAPTNGSFQAFVTAMRVLEGDQRAAEWLQAMLANDVQPYSNNTAIVEATASGEILVGLVNHYYLYRFLAEQGDSFAARNHYMQKGGAGSMVNIAGVGIVDTADNVDSALQFVRYLLSDEAQQYFAQETNEYPLTGAPVTLAHALPPLSDLGTPDLDLSRLDDLQGTLTLLQESGALD